MLEIFRLRGDIVVKIAKNYRFLESFQILVRLDLGLLLPSPHGCHGRNNVSGQKSLLRPVCSHFVKVCFSQSSQRQGGGVCGKVNREGIIGCGACDSPQSGETARRTGVQLKSN
jgi:hypothetical protein